MVPGQPVGVPAVEFELENVGPGPDPLSLSQLAAEFDVVVLMLQRDHYCTNCRKQVRTVADRYSEFEQRNVQVVSVVPEERALVQSWQDSYDLPYPLLADPEATVGDAYNQPVRFGFLGSLSDFVGRMPAIVIIDCRSDRPRIAWTDTGRSTFDRPSVDDVLAAVDTILSA